MESYLTRRLGDISRPESGWGSWHSIQGRAKCFSFHIWLLLKCYWSTYTQSTKCVEWDGLFQKIINMKREIIIENMGRGMPLSFLIKTRDDETHLLDQIFILQILLLKQKYKEKHKKEDIS